jgi:uncharacterized secreted protein with C-terminal beta-propeller domain
MSANNSPFKSNLQSALLRHINDAQASNLQLVKDSSRADKTYQLEWRRYQEFIDRERKNKRIAEGQFYLTRKNVNVYFGKIVNKLTVVPDSARRVVSSLQWYSDNLEHPIKKFVVESDAVKAAL